MFDKFTDLSEANDDIQKSLSLDFVEKWSGKMLMTPVVFVDWAQMWATMRVEHPEVLGDWTTPLKAGDELKDILGELAEPLADFVRLSRHSSILQNLNLYTGLGYLELVFDVENGAEVYQLSEKSKALQNELVRSKLQQLVSAYANF
jgi:hypothetical protein